MRFPRVVAALIVFAAAVAAYGSEGGQSGEDLPRRQLESGMTFMNGQRYTEALKDFQAIIDSFPKSQVADNALLQIAMYQLDIAHDLAATQAAVDQLLKIYPDTDSAPMAYVLGGRVSMFKGRSASEVDSAVASFERVERLFPGNDAVPAAGFYAGEALRLVRRYEDALERYRRVSASYPSSPWAARANLAAGYCLVLADRAPAALPEVQRVRAMMPQSVEAQTALNINSILYRLHVRAPATPAFAFSGRYIGDERANLDDVVGIRVDALSRILLGHGKGISLFDAAKGTLSSTVTANKPSAFFLDESNRVVFAREGSLHTERVASTAADGAAGGAQAAQAARRNPVGGGALDRSSPRGGQEREDRDPLQPRGPLPRSLRAGDQYRAAGGERARRCGDDRQGCESDQHPRSRRQAAVAHSRQGAELSAR